MLGVPRILWGAIFGSTFVFVFMMLVVHPENPGPPPPMLPPMFALVALTTAVMSFVVPRVQYRQAVARVKLDTIEEMADAGSDVLPYRSGPKRRVFAKPDEARRKAFLLFQTPFILSLALSESIALFGFVLGFMGFASWIAYPFFGVSWVLFALRFPTEDKVLRPFEAGTGAYFPS
ncbi:MAG: hypothetical protein KC776_19470 [Myxococcales bacterium]|nr:hypothetical protein [Myxococcales bacterium]MCB9580127.1 hypothetical protein [Polyangiaceae bacterium]